LISALILFLWAAAAWAVGDGLDLAGTSDGKYTVTYYPSDVSRADLVKMLNMRASGGILAGVPSGGDELSRLLDTLYIQVSDILAIHLYSLKINIKICRDITQLKDIYRRMFNVDLGPRQSFYVYNSNTIYVSREGFRREIVGHEMAHAIISHYFVVPAPVKIQEILAMYAEYQLRQFN